MSFLLEAVIMAAIVVAGFYAGSKFGNKFSGKKTPMSQALTDLQAAVSTLLDLAKQKDDEIASLKAQLADTSTDSAMEAMTEAINAYAPPAPQAAPAVPEMPADGAQNG